MIRLAALAMVLLIAACGGDPSGTGEPADPTNDATDDAGGDMPDPDERSEDNDPGDVGGDLPIDEHAETWTLVEATPGMAALRPVPWESYQLLDEPRIRLLYWSGVEPCSVLDHVEVVETDTTVTVTLFEGYEPTEDGSAPVCPEMARYTGTDVTLDAPVGDREVVDGAPDA